MFETIFNLDSSDQKLLIPGLASNFIPLTMNRIMTLILILLNIGEMHGISEKLPIAE